MVLHHFQKISDALTLRLGQESKQFDATRVRDRVIKRKLKVISEVGASALPEEKLNMYNEIKAKMNKIYSTAKVPSYRDKSVMMAMDPDIREVTATSRDPDELEYYFTEWRKVTGREMRDLYLQFIDLTNEAAR